MATADGASTESSAKDLTPTVEEPRNTYDLLNAQVLTAPPGAILYQPLNWIVGSSVPVVGLDWPQFTQAAPPPRTPEEQAAWEAGVKERERERLRARYGGESAAERVIELED